MALAADIPELPESMLLPIWEKCCRNAGKGQRRFLKFHLGHLQKISLLRMKSKNPRMSRFSRIPGFQQSQILDFPDFSKQMFLFAQEIICLFIQSFLELSKISLLPNSYY